MTHTIGSRIVGPGCKECGTTSYEITPRPHFFGGLTGMPFDDVRRMFEDAKTAVNGITLYHECGGPTRKCWTLALPDEVLAADERGEGK